MITLPWLLAAIIFLIDQWLMTRLVRQEYDEHRAIWQQDGQPRPMFWVPPEGRFRVRLCTYRLSQT